MSGSKRASILGMKNCGLEGALSLLHPEDHSPPVLMAAFSTFPCCSINNNLKAWVTHHYNVCPEREPARTRITKGLWYYSARTKYSAGRYPYYFQEDCVTAKHATKCNYSLLGISILPPSAMQPRQATGEGQSQGLVATVINQHRFLSLPLRRGSNTAAIERANAAQNNRGQKTVARNKHHADEDGQHQKAYSEGTGEKTGSAAEQQQQ